ncbi:YcaO cyclodehydratase, ATP-ad Mg2+-binding [anaerobic digester metagenome]
MQPLKSCPKRYRAETQRAVDPETTLRMVEAVVPTTGITRIAEITGLDRIGIPVFSCIRPTAADGAISVYNGKGATPIAARVSAVMEGIERFSAELMDRSFTSARFSDLGSGVAIDPVDLVLPDHADPDASLPWVEGRELVSGESVLVPAHAVFHPLPAGAPRLFRTSTNGIASGNTLEEAVFHALAEVVERDAWSLVEMTRDAGAAIDGAGNPTVQSLLDRFQEANVPVILRDITSDIGIPTIAAVAEDPVLRDPALLVIGMGTHTNPAIASLRALTEVAQSRATQIHGAREDTTTGDLRRVVGYDRARRLNRYWFESDCSVEPEALPALDTDDFFDDIHLVCNRLRSVGLDRVIAVDLTRPEIGIPVVRVIVPGLECYAMDPERKGDRCRHARDHRLPRSEL